MFDTLTERFGGRLEELTGRFGELRSKLPRLDGAELEEHIRHETEERLRHYARYPEDIDERLRQLDEEWDLEHAVEASAATVALTGLGMAALGFRTFLMLPILVCGFLLSRALGGWSPPVTAFRARGFRTPAEIERERSLLRALRGDYDELRQGGAGGPESLTFERFVGDEH